MTTHHTKRKKYILLPLLPLIGLLLFAATMNGMKDTEQTLITLYTEHATLLEEVANNPAQRANLTAHFADKIKLSPEMQARLRRSAHMQIAIDSLTFSKPHCLSAPKSTSCKVYSADLVNAAKNRQAKILFLTGQEPPSESIISGTQYTTKDHARTAILLILEGLAISSILLWIWSKR